jgi:DNA-directed RNA polymerase specialized sigma24 family protein
VGPTLRVGRTRRRRFSACVFAALLGCQNVSRAATISARDRVASLGESRKDATVTEAADEAGWYDAIAEFGSSLARLAAAYGLDRAQQQDLLQEIHLAWWRSFATFRNQCSLRTWVYRVAHNTAATHVRRQMRVGVSPLECVVAFRRRTATATSAQRRPRAHSNDGWPMPESTRRDAGSSTWISYDSRSRGGDVPRLLATSKTPIGATR